MTPAVFLLSFLFIKIESGLGSEHGHVACHIPLDPWNPALSKGHPPFEIEKADLSLCTEVVFSTDTPLFTASAISDLDTSAPEADGETLKRFLSLMTSKFPNISRSFSLRSKHSSTNLKTLFSNSSVIGELLNFLNNHNVSYFDLASNLVETYMQFIPVLGQQLATQGRKLSITVVTGISKNSLLSITSYVDMFRLIPDCNLYYTNCQDVLSETLTEVPALDSNELGIGRFLRTFPFTQIPRNKLLLGISFDTTIWQTSGEFITDTSTLKGRTAIKRFMSYRQSCDFMRVGWKEVAKKQTNFGRTLIAPCHTAWAVQVDPTIINRKLTLLLQHGFTKFGVYDLASDDSEHECLTTGTSGSRKKLPLTAVVQRLVLSSNITEKSSEANPSLCIPFYGLSEGCATLP